MRIAVRILFVILAVAVVYRLLIALSGVRVTSWFRTPWHNLEVGGVRTSLHQLGWGFDVVPDTQETLQKISWVPWAYIKREGDHIHLQVIP